ncbi:glutamate receptor ionotropic, delta-1-like [Homarus americanus]|uniref:glutamate receptor ionotropic, delta-1-like n=1 Tax=Homarus americanus TaxID=6706 RepID=UPI001C43C032|nr:glutamate receptor ionotropic, delta-1-like [Homarus americanus]
MVGKASLRIAAGEWVPWTRVEMLDNDTVTIHGPMDNLLRILANKLNFEYELVQPPDRMWGVAGPDGNWTGMLGMLQRQEVEMAVGPFAVSRARETVCDFSEPVYSENMAILMVRPSLQSDLSGFLKPFTPTVWSLVLAAMVCICLTFATVTWQEAKLFNTSNRRPVSTAVIWVFKALTQESTEWLPKTDGSRLVVTTWLLASLVFMSSYSGILTAMLTVPRVTIPIDSVEDLVTQKDLQWRLEAGSMMFQYYQEATEGIRKAVFDGHEGTFQDCWAARQPIAQGQFAGICDKTTMKKAMSWDFSSTGQCHLYISREVAYSNVMIAMAYRTNSSYKEKADYWLRRVKESGVINLWLQKEITNTSQCLLPPSAGKSTNTVSGLDLDSFMGSIIVLAGGLTTAMLVFLLELCVSWTLAKCDILTTPSTSISPILIQI